MGIYKTDNQIIATLNKCFLPMARMAIFIVYFWFGFLKLVDLSPAGPIAAALSAHTIGLVHFSLAFKLLAVYECAIGVLFLFPKATRIVIPLLLIHMIIVCSPLLFVPHLVWSSAFVPTLGGQYIIKNVAIIALAIGIAAQMIPFKPQSGKNR